jgi:hypothetical protein
MSERNPPGKVVGYFYLRKGLKKEIDLEAVRQECSTSLLVEAILEGGIKTPPVVGKKDTRGRKRKGAKAENDSPS